MKPIKILVVGDKVVGKTELLNAFVSRDVDITDEEYTPIV